MQWHRVNTFIPKGRNGSTESIEMGPKKDQNPLGPALNPVTPHLASRLNELQWAWASLPLWPCYLQLKWPLSWAASTHCLWLSLADILHSWYCQHLGYLLQLRLHHHSFTHHPLMGRDSDPVTCCQAGLPFKSGWKKK